MGVVTVFPDTLELVRAHLEEQLGVAVGTRLPSTWPADGFLEVSRTGGVRTRLADEVLISVAGWHPTRPAEAERLTGEAVSEVLALEGGALAGWQVLDTGNPGGVAAQPDPRFPENYRATAMTRLRVRGVTRKEKEAPPWV